MITIRSWTFIIELPDLIVISCHGGRKGCVRLRRPKRESADVPSTHHPYLPTIVIFVDDDCHQIIHFYHLIGRIW
jgi:hypothetical protein